MTAEATVPLFRADRALDLWSSIEAAQYARAVLHQPATDPAEARVIDEFIAAFSSIIEGWDEVAQRNAATVLQALDVQLGALGRHGLFVHWACIERDLGCTGGSSLSMPMAVIRIGREPDGQLDVELPGEVILAQEDGAQRQ
jgi:hypothetical protein